MGRAAPAILRVLNFVEGLDTALRIPNLRLAHERVTTGPRKAVTGSSPWRLFCWSRHWSMHRRRISAAWSIADARLAGHFV